MASLVHGQVLVDPLKLLLVHEDWPIADPCLDKHWNKIFLATRQELCRTHVRHQQDEDSFRRWWNH